MDEIFPDSLKAAFGRFLIKWSGFEWHLAWAFSYVLDVSDQKGFLIWFSSGGNAARELFKAMIADSGSLSPPPELMSLLVDVDKIAAIRNDLVHGKWIDYREGKANVQVAKPRNPMRIYAFDISEEELNDYCDQIEALIDRLDLIDFKAVERKKK